MMQTLYRGGMILDETGELVRDHGLLVDGGAIARVAPSPEFVGFAGHVVDTSGGTLIPGLVDCHVHLTMGGQANPAEDLANDRPAVTALKALTRAKDTLAGGVTALRDCGGKDYIDLAVRDACNSGQFVGPIIRASGRLICMTGGHGSRIGRVADGPDEVIKAVREQIQAGSDLIKMMATGGVMTPGVNPEDAHYTQEELTAGVTEARRFHRRCACHAQGSEGILNATRAGVASIEHGIFMTRDCVEEMCRRGTYLVPTLAAVKNILGNADNGVPAFAVEKAARVAERHLESVRMFYEAGGLIAMGTDAGTPFNKHGANAAELAYMVDVGMSPRDTIIAATRNGAELMGLADSGVLGAGKAADMVLVDGNPLENIAMVADRANHRAVIRNGAIIHQRPAVQVAVAAE